MVEDGRKGGLPHPVEIHPPHWRKPYKSESQQPACQKMAGDARQYRRVIGVCHQFLYTSSPKTPLAGPSKRPRACGCLPGMGFAPCPVSVQKLACS